MYFNPFATTSIFLYSVDILFLSFVSREIGIDNKNHQKEKKKFALIEER